MRRLLAVVVLGAMVVLSGLAGLSVAGAGGGSATVPTTATPPPTRVLSPPPGVTGPNVSVPYATAGTVPTGDGTVPATLVEVTPDDTGADGDDSPLPWVFLIVAVVVLAGAVFLVARRQARSDLGSSR